MSLLQYFQGIHKAYDIREWVIVGDVTPLFQGIHLTYDIRERRGTTI
jgi:hypothetical protein